MNASATSAAERIRTRALAEDRPVLGGWLTVPSAPLLAALAGSALDYVGLDCQHGLLSESDVVPLIAGSGPAGVDRDGAARLVRVCANRPELIGRVLDGGADGIIVPTVNSADEARAAVAAVRFPPEGNRSYGPMAPFLPRDPAELGRRPLVLMMIETAAGLDAAEDILAVPGIDGVYVGPADLGLALGVGAGQFPAGESLLPALRTIVKAGQAAGAIVGIHAGSELFVPRYAELGFRLLTMGTEGSFVAAGVARVLQTAGGGAPATAPRSGSPY